MHIITRKRLNEFAQKYPENKSALLQWYQLMKQGGFNSIEEYQNLVEMLDNLIDEVGEDETHPLASLMEIIGVLIEQYENQNIPETF
ncbi:hypothetical protein ACE09Y_12630 [Raphidiopsis sp. BLCC-F218]|jgi:mRNA-degrading endonuclease HigB of HigAB toxin-antitoxin module